MPEGENIRKAVKWIGEIRAEEKDKKISGLIDEASIRFNLSPKEQGFLLSFYKENES